MRVLLFVPVLLLAACSTGQQQPLGPQHSPKPAQGRCTTDGIIQLHKTSFDWLLANNPEDLRAVKTHNDSYTRQCGKK